MHKKGTTPSITEPSVYEVCLPCAPCLQIHKRSILICFAVHLVFLVGCLQIPATPIEQASEHPKTLVVSTAPPTLTVETTPLSTLAPNLTSLMSDCRVGSIMFESFGIAGSTSPSVYLACADGSQMYKTVPDPLLFIDNLSSGVGMRVWVTEEGNALKLTGPLGEDTIKSLQDDTETGRISSPSWSPNGEYIAYLRYIANGDGSYLYNRVDVVHVATGKISPDIVPENEFTGNQIDQGWEWLQWSPTAGQILLYSRQKPFTIAEISCDSSHVCTAETRLIGVKPSRKYPNRPWAPDGQRIAYACYTTSATGAMLDEGLCIQDTHGVLTAEFKESDFGIKNIDAITWSLDGNRVAFTASLIDETDIDIFVLSLNNAAIYNLTSELAGDQVSPTWIPRKD